MPLTIVANIHAVPGKEDLVKAELEKMVAPTRAEDGCITYDLHRDNGVPGHFMFFEIWHDRDAWQKHMHAPHLAVFGAATEGAIKTLTINEMHRVA